MHQDWIGGGNGATKVCDALIAVRHCGRQPAASFQDRVTSRKLIELFET
jgi:hypothetical protein